MKLKPFQKHLQEKNIDLAIFLPPDPTIFYFTQIQHLAFPCLFINPQTSKLLVTSLDYSRVKEESSPPLICLKTNLFIFLKKYFKGFKKIKKIGINQNYLSLNNFQKLKKISPPTKFLDLSPFLENLRSQKTEKEISHIKRACSIADLALINILQNFRFSTESQIEAALDCYAKNLGADQAFKTIVASGKNSSLPHHLTRNQKLRRGFCILDFGVCYRGYRSDITRTIYLGQPSKKENEIYNLILNTQKNLINFIKPKLSCSQLDQKSRHLLKKYSQNILHSLGHGLGIQPHEKPNLSLKSTDTFQKNQTFTIEPGLYFPQRFGIRIEDTILLKNKPLLLTKTPKELLTFKI